MARASCSSPWLQAPRCHVRISFIDGLYGLENPGVKGRRRSNGKSASLRPLLPLALVLTVTGYATRNAARRSQA